MNFTVIDGDEKYRELLPRFSEMYNDRSIPVTDIKEDLRLSVNVYRKLRRDAIEEGLIQPRTKEYTKKKSYKSNPKYIGRCTQNSQVRFNVVRRRNGKVSFYGSFKDYRQAERMVELLKECDWDISKRKELKERVLRGE